MAIDNVGGTPNIPTYTGVNQTQTPTKIEGRDITGSGLVSQSGSVPMTPNDPSYGAVLESIARLMPEITGEVLDVVLLEITTKMKEIEEASQKDRIKVDQETKRTALTEKQDKLKEAESKIKEAIDKREHASIWDKIKMAFQAIAAALMIVLGALLTAVPGFQAVGALMIMAGAISLVMVIDSAVQKATGMGIMGNIMKGFGASDEVCQGFDMAFKICLAVAGIATSVAAFFVPGGQASAVANMIQSVSTIVNATMGIATGVGDIAAGVVRYDAAKIENEGKMLQAQGKEMEAFIQQLDDFIDQALQRLMGASDRFNVMLDGIMEAIQDSAKTVSKAKFTG